MRIAEVAERAGHAGVHVTFKIDGERERRRWTVVLSSPPYVGEYWVTRTDLDRIDQVLDFLRRKLVERLGSHGWLDEPVEDADGFADVMEEIGATGAVLLVDYRPETRWRLTGAGVQIGDFPSLDACLLDGYDRVVTAAQAPTQP